MIRKALIVLGIALGMAACGRQKFEIVFDSSHEVSGGKFALNQINPQLPADWDGYNYVVIEFRISTPQRFHIGFTTDDGYNELRVMSYVPNAWNRLAIPLDYYRELPATAVDLAATFNKPRYTGWINLGGRRTALHGVDSIGIRMRAPIGNPKFELRNVTLAVDDPGDTYLEAEPAFDEFGQSALVDYPEKARSIEQLQAEWLAEEQSLAEADDFGYSAFGGYRNARIDNGTGFFRTVCIDGRWWFVDPEGYLFLSVGVDCITPARGGVAARYEQRREMFGALPPDSLAQTGWNGEKIYSYGIWNLCRRFGADYEQRSVDMVFDRMDKWGINTIGNWSDSRVMERNRKPYMLSMRTYGVDRRLMGLADVYEPDYQKKMDEAIDRSLSRYRTNPWVIGFFVGNEPAWLGEEERLCDIILAGEERPIKSALQRWLAAGDTPERRVDFIYDTFRIYLESVRRSQKRFAPEHLNIGIRFGNISAVDDRILEICGRNFDVISFNCYALKPDAEAMDRVLRITGLPMIIGEYHFGTVDRGLAQSLWQVDSQQQRGVAYRYYTEQGYSHPGLIGTGYFQWCDQDIAGRALDGENYNCGLIDITDRPYREQVDAMIETAKRLYDVHRGAAEPFPTQPDRARGHESIPDLWNE